MTPIVFNVHLHGKLSDIDFQCEDPLKNKFYGQETHGKVSNVISHQ